MPDLDDPTLESAPDTSRESVTLRRARLIPALSIAWLADARRAGEVAELTGKKLALTLTRKDPFFAPLSDPTRRAPLTDPYLSKSPAFHLAVENGGDVVIAPAADMAVEVDGTPLEEPRRLSWEEVDTGVVLTVGSRAVLCLHHLEASHPRGPRLGMVGDSDAIEQVRINIRRLADADSPVLIRGETGTGKELVARALHASGRRASAPFVAVHMGGLQQSMAVAQLFGHEKGAFTGALAAKPGFFGEADGGTIFLDEIGLAPPDIQQMLYRVIENGEVQPIGASGRRRVNVRVLAATDAPLEQEIQARRFHGPLFFRLAAFQIALPPLRTRRQDIGPLLYHFLAEALRPHRALERVHELEARRLWLRATDVARLALMEWPGNIRDLRNVARRMAVLFRDASRVDLAEVLDGGLVSESRQDETPSAAPAAAGSATAASADSPRARRRTRPPASLTREEVVTALHGNGGSVPAAAAALGISKVSLYEQVRRYQIPTAHTIPEDDLRAAVAELRGDLVAIAERFGVSLRALQLRLRFVSMVEGAEPEEDDR